MRLMRVNSKGHTLFVGILPDVIYYYGKVKRLNWKGYELFGNLILFIKVALLYTDGVLWAK